MEHKKISLRNSTIFTRYNNTIISGKEKRCLCPHGFHKLHKLQKAMQKEEDMKKEQFIKKINLRIKCCIALILIGVLGVAAGIFLEQITGLTVSDWSSGYYLGTGFGLIGASIATIIKQQILLKNPEKLEQRMLMEYDERNLQLREKTMTYAGYSLAFILYIGICIFGVVNVTIANTMLYILCGYVVLVFVINTILRKFM